MWAKAGALLFGGWGAVVIAGVFFAALVVAWQVDKIGYGDRRVAKQELKQRKAADANVKKADRVRDRVLSGSPRGLQPSPYVRR